MYRKSFKNIKFNIKKPKLNIKFNRKQIITIILVVMLFVIPSSDLNSNYVNDKYVMLYPTLNNVTDKEEMIENNIPNVQLILNEDAEVKNEIMISEYTEARYENAMEVVESLVGLPGSCLYIARLFIERFRGPEHSVDNAYLISDDPEPGDLIYYVNGGAGVEHWAVYLADNVALQGNYNGRAIISTVYLRGATAPIYYRVP